MDTWVLEVFFTGLLAFVPTKDVNNKLQMVEVHATRRTEAGPGCDLQVNEVTWRPIRKP